MNNVSSEPTNIWYARRRRGQWTAVTLMLIIFIPMAVAMFVYYTGVGMPAGTINKGVLLQQPVNFGNFSLNNTQHQTWNIEEQKSKWRWLVIGKSGCDARCEEQLYITRQAHIRLGEKAGRVERIFLVPGSTLQQGVADSLQRDHPHMTLLTLSDAEFQQLMTALGQQLPATVNPESSIFLMDPEAWLMMAYQDSHQGGDLLDDIKRMLKLSYED